MSLFQFRFHFATANGKQFIRHPPIGRQCSSRNQRRTTWHHTLRKRRQSETDSHQCRSGWWHRRKIASNNGRRLFAGYQWRECTIETSVARDETAAKSGKHCRFENITEHKR